MDKYIALYCFVFLLDLWPFIVQAQQRPRIIEHPADAVAARDEPHTLNCKAAGRPHPTIIWYHNGTPLVPSERRVVLPEGSLFFLRVMQNKREQDAGVYWCEAKSPAGIAVSHNATLQIAMLRDDFRSVPKNTVALVGGPVMLNCTPPRGIPEPSVLWYKDGKLLDLSGKRLGVDSGNLIISEVQSSDAGTYECTAQSMAGSKSAPPAVLSVLAPPTIIKGPQDTEVIEGDGLDLPCELTGDPKPIVSWHRENGHLPETRSRILLDNTLRIEDTRPEDQGRYICKGHNEGGNVSVAVKLYVYATPTFIEAPSDVDVKEGGNIYLPCRAQGRPKARIVWDRIDVTQTVGINDDVSQYLEQETQEELLAKAKIMSLRSKREHLNQTEVIMDESLIEKIRSKRSLIIHDNNRNDSAHLIPDLYIDDNNNRDKREQIQNFILTEFKQIMRDQNQDNYETTFRKKRDITPAARLKRADDDDDTNNDDDDISVGGAISSNVNDDDDDIGDDIIDGISGGSHTFDDDLSSDSTPILFFSTPTPNDSTHFDIGDNGDLILRDVTRHHQGWYACAALNEAGSTVKRIFVRVISNSDPTESLPLPPESSGSRWSSDQSIVVTSITPISAHSLDVNWELANDAIPASTITLHYRPILKGTTTTKTTTPGSKDFLTSATTLDAKIHRLNDLKAHTEYEIFATVPNGLGGSISNMRKGMTMDGPPSAPPTDVRVGVINNTAAYVRWSPPPQHLLNGELTGYNIQIKSNVTNKILGQMSLNATTQSVVINSLIPGGRYIACVAPLTAGGLGPYSAPAPLHMDPSFIPRPPRTDPASNGWSSVWMSGIALGIFGVCLSGGAIFALYWARRNKRNMKASYPGPILTATLPDKQHTLWLHGNPMLKPTHSLAPPAASEYAEVVPTGLVQKQINSTSAPPEPYATVTLQRGGGCGSGGGGGGGGGGGVIMNGGNNCASVSDDTSCVKCSVSPSSSEYNAPVREPLNLCDVLPPPPDHPYGSYKPPNNMTIRTNPAAMSPQVVRRAVPPTPPRWGTLPPPIPNFPQNWIQQRRLDQHQHQQNHLDNNQDFYSENDYESGSVLYEQCCRRPNQNYFNGVEANEEYYRNVNMEFFEDQDFEPSTPPPPCPDSSYNTNKINANLRLIANGQITTTDSPLIMNPNKRQQQMPRSQGNSTTASATTTATGTTQSAHSSDESESDNRWAPRSRRSRSRSKSGDRKFRNGGHVR